MVEALKAGADDYIVKPFSPRELVARVEVVLRRSSNARSEKPVECGLLRLDPVSHRIFIGDSVLEMPPREYKLLQFFMTHPERAYTRSQLLDQVWGSNVYVEERTVDLHIRRLRRILQTSHSDQISGYVQTVHGLGYRFAPLAIPDLR